MTKNFKPNQLYAVARDSKASKSFITEATAKGYKKERFYGKNVYDSEGRKEYELYYDHEVKP